MKKILLAAGMVALMGSTAMAETIGASIARFDDNGLTIMRNGMTAHIESLSGVELQMEDAQDDVARQLDQINNFFLIRSCKGVVVTGCGSGGGAGRSRAIVGDGSRAFVTIAHRARIQECCKRSESVDSVTAQWWRRR